MTKVILNRWNKIVNDPRIQAEGVASMLSNVNASQKDYTLQTTPSTESGDSAASTSQKQNFDIGLWTPTGNYRLFSLGVKSGASTSEVLMKDLTTGGTNDLDDDGWMTPSANQSTRLANFQMFKFYEKTGKIYSLGASRYVMAFTPGGGTAWDDSAYDYGSTFTNATQAIIHSKDDIMYFGIDNKVIKNNNGSFSTGITLPSYLYITNVVEYGNYLAIFTSALDGYGKSRCFLWDRDATITLLDENIDFGEGVLKVAEEVDGFLVSLSVNMNLGNKLTVRVYSGGLAAKKVKYLELDGTTIDLPAFRQKVGNKLYFLMRGTFNGTDRGGLWSLEHKTDGTWALVHEQKVINDTAIFNGSPSLNNFFIVGKYTFIAYKDASDNFALSKTKNDGGNFSYTATSLVETTINPEMKSEDRSKLKQLNGVRLHYTALPSLGTIKLSYRVDGGSWTEIFTDSTDNSVYMESQFDVNKSTFTEGREYEFKIEWVGNIDVIELTYDYDIKSSQIK